MCFGELVQSLDTLIAGMKRLEAGADEIRASVGRRLAGATGRQQRVQLGQDSEESPLQSKRSSTSITIKHNTSNNV